MDNKKSIVWINTLRAFCIMAVFLVHCQSYSGTWMGDGVNQVIHTFYVNAFFFISGYLLFWKQLSEPIILEISRFYIRSGGGKRLFLNVLYRIIIPSIIFSAIEFFPSCLIQGRGIDIGYALFKTIGGGTYWFTSALVVAELILLLLFCTRKRSIWFYAIVCLALTCLAMVILKMNVLQNGLWAWRQGLLSMAFLALGGIYWRYEVLIDKMMRWWFAIPLLAAYFIMLLGLKEYNNPVISTLTIQPLGFVTSAIACLLLVWLCKILPEVKPLTFIGQNSLGFYFMSGALPIIFSLIAHKIVAGSHIRLLLIVWTACMVVAYLAVTVINKWLPWLWDLRLLRKRQ